MIGKLLARPAEQRLGFGRWEPKCIVAGDGCEYAIAAGDLPPDVKPGEIVRFEAAGARAVNITSTGRRP